MVSGQDGRRILSFLSNGAATVRAAAVDGKLLLEADGRGAISTTGRTFDLLVAQGIVIREGHTVALSAQGISLARRLSSSTDRFQDAHRDIELAVLDSGQGAVPVLVNMAESPLAQLMRRRTKNGEAFLARREFEAGERLRADYTRGQIMPRLGANWIASVASGKRAGGGVAELTDAALGARYRVEKALEAVGPELAGVLVDVCCFLKGLEQVETERGWPVRSAKLMLKTGLGVLARHYFPTDEAPQQGHRRLLHWGAEDYRPRIGG